MPTPGWMQVLCLQVRAGQEGSSRTSLPATSHHPHNLRSQILLQFLQHLEHQEQAQLPNGCSEWPWQSCCFLPKPEQRLRTVLDPAAAPRKGLMSGCLSNSRSTVFRDEGLKRLSDFVNFWTVEKLKDWMENGSKCGYSLDGWPTVLGAAQKDYDGQNIHQQMCFDHLQHPLEGCYSNNSLSPFSFKASAAESKYCAARVTANSAKLCRNQKAIYLSSSFFYHCWIASQTFTNCPFLVLENKKAIDFQHFFCVLNSCSH